MAGGILPQEAVGASAVVLLYSAVCFTLCTLLVCLLWSFGERWSFVAIFSIFTATSTLASMAQQIHYATSWRAIKEAQLQQAIKSLSHPGLAFGGAAEPTDVVLFYIQFYCYNTMSLNILFWAIALFIGSWGIRPMWLGDWYDRVGPLSKVLSVVFPALIVGLMQINAIVDNSGAFFVISNITFLLSMSTGTVLLILILYRYVKTRRLVMNSAQRGGWWASKESDTETSTTATTSGRPSKRSIYDRALLARFTIGFVILAIFEAAIIAFNVFQASNNANIAASKVPNFSISSAIADIMLFIPGVTASLVAFLVFGTTKSWRQYRDLVIRRPKIFLKTRRQEDDGENSQGLEFQRLSSIPNQAAEEEAARAKDAENRVRMFARESSGSTGFTNISGPSNPTRDQTSPRIQQFHKPFPSISESTKTGFTSGTIEVGLGLDIESGGIIHERYSEGPQR